MKSSIEVNSNTATNAAKVDTSESAEPAQLNKVTDMVCLKLTYRELDSRLASYYMAYIYGCLV